MRLSDPESALPRSRLGTALLALLLAGHASASGDSAGSGTAFRVGIGDRVAVHRDGRRIDVVDEARAHGLRTDYLQLWLPKVWEDSWVVPEELDALAHRGVTPVIAHWYFGDEISKERILADRRAWHQSLGRMARRIAIGHPVLVLLEPEFNNAPPEGETATTDWRGFADEIREAARIIRHFAPQARVGICAGDFSPSRNLERALGAVAAELDFLAFQEMRADTRHARSQLDVGAAAVDYARYLQSAFGRPILLGYVAVASHGGWEHAQAAAIESLTTRREELADAGVFGAIWFQLRDDPEHVGWFGDAEPFFGVLDAQGVPKPALDALRELSRATQAPAGRPAPVPAAPGSPPTPR